MEANGDVGHISVLPSTQADPFDFDDLEPKVQRVRYKGKVYWLREASEGASVAWRNVHTSSARHDEQGKFISVGAIADAEPVLVSKCLYYADAATGGLPVLPTGEPDAKFLVPEALIRGFPHQVISKLYSWIMDNSGLREPDTEESLKERIKADVAKLRTIRTAKHPKTPKPPALNPSGYPPVSSVLDPTIAPP